MEISKLFFNSPAVLAATTKAERKVLSRIGAFLRSDIRQNIRNRRRPSRQGEGPTNQTGILKNFTTFDYDPANHSVVAGPKKLSGMTSEDCPFVLEHGGMIKTSARIRRLNKNAPSMAYISARPYVRPALNKNINIIPEQWRDAIVAY
jgi:hypothetical protein